MNTNSIFSIKNHVVILTGAVGGLGSELAKILVNSGAFVVLVDTNTKKLETLNKNLSSDALIQVCDVTNAKEIKNLIANVHKHYQKIDVLINCAGILGADHFIFEIEEPDWDRVMEVNLKGTWLISTLVAKYMVDNQIKGNIVNISSSLGVRTQLKRLHYATSKAAVEHLTRNMAMELIPYGIRVNCLAPGWMATEMVREILEGPEGEKWRQIIPMKREAQPEELIGPLLLLASNASSYMTGAILRVDGGYSLWQDFL